MAVLYCFYIGINCPKLIRLGFCLPQWYISVRCQNDVNLAKIHQMKMVYFKRDFAYFGEEAKHCCNGLYFPTAFYHIIPTLFHFVPSDSFSEPQLSHDAKSITLVVIYGQRLMTAAFGTVRIMIRKENIFFFSYRLVPFQGWPQRIAVFHFEPVTWDNTTAIKSSKADAWHKYTIIVIIVIMMIITVVLTVLYCCRSHNNGHYIQKRVRLCSESVLPNPVRSLLPHSNKHALFIQTRSAPLQMSIVEIRKHIR